MRNLVNGSFVAEFSHPPLVVTLVDSFNTELHECKLTETMKELSLLGKWAVAVNWITFFFFLSAEFVYFRREAWLISNLHDDDEMPYNQLPTLIAEEANALLLLDLRAHNRFARDCAVTLLMLCSVNLLLSCCYLLAPAGGGGRFNGVRTVSGLMTNTLLLSRRIVQNVRIAWLSNAEDLALSMFQLKARFTWPPRGGGPGTPPS